eukprot:2958583-Prymnesium_polylepis.1
MPSGRSALAAQCHPNESRHSPGLARWRKTTSSSVSSASTLGCSITSIVHSESPGVWRKRGTSSSSV